MYFGKVTLIWSQPCCRSGAEQSAQSMQLSPGTWRLCQSGGKIGNEMQNDAVPLSGQEYHQCNLLNIQVRPGLRSLEQNKTRLLSSQAAAIKKKNNDFYQELQPETCKSGVEEHTSILARVNEPFQDAPWNFVSIHFRFSTKGADYLLFSAKIFHRLTYTVP